MPVAAVQRRLAINPAAAAVPWGTMHLADANAGSTTMDHGNARLVQRLTAINLPAAACARG